MKRFYIFLALCCTMFLLQGAGCADYTKSLGKGYYYRDEGGELVDIHCEEANGGIIPPTVIDYTYNKHFILAKQKPYPPANRNIMYPVFDYKYGMDTLYYWIVIKKEHRVIGPLASDEFQQKCKDLNVPEKLQLK